MALHTINTTVADRQLGKKIICCNANSSSLITSATKNNARVQMSTASWTCVQYVHHSPVRHPAGDASTGWYCHQWTSVTVHTTPARLPASIPRSRTFYHGTRAPAGPPKWHNPPGLSPAVGWPHVRFDEGDILTPQVRGGVSSRVLFL